MTAVVTDTARTLTSLTLRRTNTLQAEETAIVLAISQTEAMTVISDSQAACRNYINGRISKTALQILQQNPPRRNATILWTPAHSSLRGNLVAHTSARELAGRALQEDQQRVNQPSVTYREIIQHYRLSRQIYLPGHKSLTKEQETSLRQLQTNTFPHPARLHAIFPTMYTSTCPHCGELSTFISHGVGLST